MCGAVAHSFTLLSTFSLQRYVKKIHKVLGELLDKRCSDPHLVAKLSPEEESRAKGTLYSTDFFHGWLKLTVSVLVHV